jgi:uncharacterized protein
VSEQNVEIVRRAFEAFNQRGLEGLLEFADPRIEWSTTGIFLEAGTYRGHEGIRRYLGAMMEEFDDVRTESVEFIDGGDVVVVPSRFSGRGKRSGAPVDLEITFVYTVEDGQLVRVRNFQDKADALRATGLPE